MDQPILDLFSGPDTKQQVFVLPPTKKYIANDTSHSVLQLFDDIEAEIKRDTDEIRDLKCQISTLTKDTQNLQRRTENLERQTQVLQEQTQVLQEQTQILQEQTQILQEQTQILQGQVLSLRKTFNPLFCCIVLDLARKQVMNTFGLPRSTNWADVQGEELCRNLPPSPFRPSNEALQLLFMKSDIWDAGDDMAYNAEKEALAIAISDSEHDSQDRWALEALFAFIYQETFYPRL